MFDLEQHIGREIIWLRGMGWEQMLKEKKAIPNIAKRFCTTILKMVPIFEFLFMRYQLPVKMRIGYRYDEKHRAESFSNIFKYSTNCQYRAKSNTWVHRWEGIKWREGDFPLIRDRIAHPRVQQYWSGKDIAFPADSNCQNCFWKDPQQLRKNFDTNPEIMMWAAIQEQIYGRTFRDDMSLLSISKIGLQNDFAFGTGSGCQAGFCHD